MTPQNPKKNKPTTSTRQHNSAYETNYTEHADLVQSLYRESSAFLILPFMRPMRKYVT